MTEIRGLIKKAQTLFGEKLIQMSETGGLSKERYLRFLSMQYHLTKGVQQHFFAVASHSCMAKKLNLRKWLVHFAQEEEFHFEIAKADLKELGAEPLEISLDTTLWWLFYDSIVKTSPFIRLGGTCILENVMSGNDAILDSILSKSDFLTKKNTRFLTIHRHGPNLDHGNQVLEALESANLSKEEYQDLLKGADITTTFYLRATHWVVSGSALR
jgi:heme oxygenase